MPRAMQRTSRQTVAVVQGAEPEPPGVVAAPLPADPELSMMRPKRRSFTVADKLRILKEADVATAKGATGAILRREGLYSSMLTAWRQQRAAGILGASTPVKRGPKPDPSSPLQAELTKSHKENARLRLRLQQAETIIEIQKKLSALLGLTLPPDGRGGQP